MAIYIRVYFLSKHSVDVSENNGFLFAIFKPRQLIIIIIINKHFRNAQLTINRHKGARGDTQPSLTLIQVRFQ